METMAEYLAELVKAGLEDRKAASLPEGLVKNRWAFGGRKRAFAGKSTGKHAFYRYAAAGIEEAGGTDGTGKDSLSTHERSPDEILLSVSVSAGNE